MSPLTKVFVSFIAVFTLLFVPLVATTTVGAQTPKDEICKGINNGRDCTTSGNNNLGAFIRRVINIILYVVGAIAVLMIVIGGLRYVISGGDSSQTKAAKDTVLYAVIGLVVAVMAYAIVNFVVVNL